jgi:hypothetical protein
LLSPERSMHAREEKGVDEMPPIVGRGDGSQEIKELLARFDTPAYVRRARQVQNAYDELVGRCRRKRAEWLAMVRLRLGTLKALAGDWDALRPHLAEEQMLLLRSLHDDLDLQLRMPVDPTTSPRVLRRALGELRASIDRFNRRWEEFLGGIDVAPVNELRDGYNRYYVLEKECAVRSASAARHGFRRLEPLTQADFAALFPLLPDLEEP